MTRGRRTALFVPLVAIVLGLMIAHAAAAPQRLVQDAPPIEAGSGPLGEPSFRFVGQTVSGADRVELYGYLTAVAGLDPARLFVDAPASLETARFTFVAEIEGASSASRADVTITSGEGVLRLYFAEAGGAAWDDPASFADGELVAELVLDLRETLQRQAPGVGVLVGDARTEQTAAAEVSVDGDRVRFGHAGVARRLRYTGALIASERPGVAWAATVTGVASVTGRESIAVPLGEPEAPPVAASPVAQADACVGLEPWLDQTLDGLSQAAELGEGFAGTTAMDDLDPAALLDAAGQVSALASAQRESAAPAAASAANRLAVTALSTTARGVQAMAAARDANDAAAFDQARATLRDGASLLARAEEAANAVAASCAEQ